MVVLRMLLKLLKRVLKAQARAKEKLKNLKLKRINKFSVVV